MSSPAPSPNEILRLVEDYEIAVALATHAVQHQQPSEDKLRDAEASYERLYDAVTPVVLGRLCVRLRSYGVELDFRSPLTSDCEEVGMNAPLDGTNCLYL